MNIKRSIQFSLKTRAYKGKQIKDNLQIRMRVSYSSVRLDLLTGYSIDTDKWDPEKQRVKKNSYNQKKESSTDINSALDKASYEMDQAFREFEVLERVPDRDELEQAYLKRMQDVSDKADKKLRKKSSLWEAMAAFKATEARKNSWQYSTVQKFNALEARTRPSSSNSVI